MTVVKTTIKCIAKVAICFMYYLGWDVQYPYTADLMLRSPPQSQSSSRCQLLSTQTAGKRLWLHTLTGHMCNIFVRASEKASGWVFTGTLPLHRPPATCTPPHSDQQLSLSISVVSLLKAACWAPSRIPGRDTCTSTGSV